MIIFRMAAICLCSVLLSRMKRTGFNSNKRDIGSCKQKLSNRIASECVELSREVVQLLSLKMFFNLLDK